MTENDPTKLLRAYEQMESNPALTEASGLEVRDTSDPFGLSRPAQDPIQAAQQTTERLNQFLSLLIAESRLTAEQVYYAVELFALNVFNQEPAPLPLGDAQKVRKKAYEYWRASTQTRDPG